ncbi:hypothetical protein BC30090_4871 [Bacillus cereus]|uniref:hypothetical protein n=1 Tax=Bacillus cereus group TaxID=86661 RepID=UPI0002B8E5B2|nr:hypothetical protein [Bacillus paranthracis]MDU3869580.1 hypothetical protein [Bacillus paranthracis]PEF60068.1 hypothetical protein CON32_02380 [Bacillus cereus]RGO17660.1 hypothetical protein DXB28_18645 [Bacillus cereus]BCD25974.1 hypothetical protein BC30090_4871 [Bacillus cereus]
MFNKFLRNSRAKKICGIGALATFIGFSSLGSVSAGSYVDKYKQYNVGSSGGSYTNSAGFSGGGGSGNLSMTSTISKDKRLIAIKLRTSIESGDPYIQSFWAQSKTSSNVHYPLSAYNKMLRNNPEPFWGLNLPNATSSNLHINTDARSSGAGNGVQYRYVQIFKY